ncbi:MAG: xanthine dehydrogenase family protein subunit M [Sulfitobacter sp.]
MQTIMWSCSEVKYYNPNNLDVALEIAAQGNGKIVAGGTDVYPSAKPGVQHDCYLDVTRIPDLAGVSRNGDSIRFGAATTWTEIANADLPPAFDALKQAALSVGSIQIQNAGTIAGNLCNASPAADGVPPLLALDAKVELTSTARGVRVLPLKEFILGVRKTALEDDELVTAVIIPPLPKGATSAFEKLGSRRYLVISISMVATVLTLDPEGRISDVRIAVGSCSPVALRLSQLEQDLIGMHPNEVTVTEQHLSALSPLTDVRGSGAYRLDVVATQCERAIRRAAA